MTEKILYFTPEDAIEYILANFNLKVKHFSTMAGGNHLFQMEDDYQMAVFYQPTNDQVEPEINIGSLATL